ncbi:hypothetical protein [Trueperella bialowiezensis]|uniref:Uncharacterized protein n=1 Tax=Trueperella bialowiezensis TaxID=312285 RepID=A0A448PDK3_9ACTO|nr:hypothetical protein [Trueperella bialowiezensis]VEI13009.1 Uncharacterised protein [Trueperella bialowiezensis]
MVATLTRKAYKVLAICIALLMLSWLGFDNESAFGTQVSDVEQASDAGEPDPLPPLEQSQASPADDADADHTPESSAPDQLENSAPGTSASGGAR